MMRLSYLVLIFFTGNILLPAQQDSLLQRNDSMQKKPIPVLPDSVIRKKIVVQLDTILKTGDSLTNADSVVVPLKSDSAQKKIISVVPVDERKKGTDKSFWGKEILFYYLLFLLLLFGLLRRAFEKYFTDLFRVFFKTTLKQKQAREQMLHAQLPSVFMNIFFILNAGLYLNFLLEQFNLSITDNFWRQYAYCAGALGVGYLIKYFGLKITGWLLGVQKAAEAYIFIVFIINKMLGIALLPILLLLAFTMEPVSQFAFALSFILVGSLFLYRIILSFSAIRNEIKLNSFHFILYVLAFEILPLLLIYKALLLLF
jgi:hypothetical protein